MLFNKIQVMDNKIRVIFSFGMTTNFINQFKKFFYFQFNKY
jgi:hypothetical protein